LGITTIALIIAVVFAITFKDLTDAQSRVMNHCLDICKFGAGAIFGLIGGKLAK
jgi:hypothetical protein